jgi:hypothetical protein
MPSPRIKKEDTGKRFNIILTNEASEWLRKYFKKETTGIEYISESFPVIVNERLSDMRGSLSHNELVYIVKTLKVNSMSSAYAGRNITLQVADRVNYQRDDVEFGIKGNYLVQKLFDMKQFDVYCLEIWAASFYVGESSDAGVVTVDEFVEFMKLESTG